MTAHANASFEYPTKPRMWNLRYLAYAKAHGKTPEAMLDQDTTRWPGAKMTGYTQWIAWAWRSWDEVHKHGPQHVRSEEEHAQFTLWLADALITHDEATHAS